MATQTTPFQGTKFYVGIGLTEEKAITAATVKPNATITATGHGAKVGDFVKITGLGALDGFYPVKTIATDKITFADEVYTGAGRTGEEDSGSIYARDFSR